MRNGVYRVNVEDRGIWVCAGFVVKRGKIAIIAPILRTRPWLLRYAQWVCA